MGKVSKKTKAKKSDFQKVKFKVGKKLPKNLNETKATFKAKTLILKQQFQLEKEGPVSHRNLSWKELLAHLGHHNQSIKLDAINSLKEMLSQNHDLIRTEKANFLDNLCPLFTDRDYKIREAAMQLFKTFILLPNLNRKIVLVPFYGLINVHLSCAMTHISENVQHSSLKLLDILIEHMPDLVRVHAYNIFENFVDQISKSSLKGDRRTLKNDPYKMTSTQTWRHNVLYRLYKMLLIVASSNESKTKSNTNTSDIVGDASSELMEKTNKNWTITANSKSLLIEFDDFEKCMFTNYKLNDERPTIKISKVLSSKKNITEIREFFETYFKIIIPLLVDCWIEARPENKKVIENYESLSIMHSVLSIMNVLLQNLNYGFAELSKLLKTAKSLNQIRHIENLFLSDFPYSLSENFDYSAEAKKLTNQITSNSINLLLCKFCSSSLLELTDEILFSIFEYCLNSIAVNKSLQSQQDQQQQQQLQSHHLTTNELETLLNLSDTIFTSFTRMEIIKPFLVGLINYFDNAPKFSTNKWLVFEFLCKQFCENECFSSKYDNTFLVFYKKIFKYCISYEKEKKEKLENLIDWLRKLIIRKEKSLKVVLNTLEDEYINMINALDFESQEISDSSKKKLLELIYWLPKIKRYLFTKLSILILNKKLSIFNVNQVLGILKLKLEANENSKISFDQSDYLMFLLSLFNGYSAFDLTNTSQNRPKNGEFFYLDNSKFEYHQILCQHLELFLASHKNSDAIIDILISSSIPIFNRLQTVSCSTLYGTLCLVSKINDLNIISDSYTNVISWLVNAFYWTLNNLITIKTNQLGTREAIQSDLESLNKVLNKLHEILENKSRILNDCIPQIISLLGLSNNLEYTRKMFLVINHLLNTFTNSIKPSKEYFFNIYKAYEDFDNSKYVWWHEYVNLVKTL